VNSKFSMTVCVVGVLCSLGATISQVAIAEPAVCQAAFAFKSNDFGPCGVTLSFGANHSSSKVYKLSATTQITVAVAQYNSTFAANYAQWVVKRQWVAAQNSQNGLRVAKSLPSIQCQTNEGPTSEICYGVQVALSP